ncbi:MAG: hypothetical protein WCR63_05725 [Bacilli bacterium]
MFDMVKQKRKSVVLIVVFTILFTLFAYLNYYITFPVYNLWGGVDTSNAIFPHLEQGVLLLVAILVSCVLLIPDIIFFIFILANIRNYFKYSKLEKENRKK